MAEKRRLLHPPLRRLTAFLLAWIPAVALWLPGCGDDEVRPDLPASCNGSDALCDRRYDEVTYPTTHNAFSHADGPWIFPNQNHDIPRQLTDGVRALMIDVHPYDGPILELLGETFVCHATCWGGGEPLVRTLGYVNEFLDRKSSRRCLKVIANRPAHH